MKSVKYEVYNQICSKEVGNVGKLVDAAVTVVVAAKLVVEIEPVSLNPLLLEIESRTRTRKRWEIW